MRMSMIEYHQSMPRNRLKPSTNLVSDGLIEKIKLLRPLRLYIAKQKKKGAIEKSFNLRSRYCKLSPEKQAKFLQKSVDRYIELLDEQEIDENVQIECRLFDFLLKRGEQKKYFQSINAPVKPPGATVPYFTQIIKQEMEDDIDWSSLSASEQENYKKMRKAAKCEYSAQVRNFANDLPERLRTDYLFFAEESPEKSPIKNNTSFTNGHGESSKPAKRIRQRRKSLTALPDSLQTNSSTSTDENRIKLNKIQLHDLHQCIPSSLYYESDVPDSSKPNFTRMHTKNSYIRSLYNQLNDDDRLKYIAQSIQKWNEFLHFNPQIIDNLIPTLHLVLTRNDDLNLYFSSIGLPSRPPINCYLLYHHEKDENTSSQTWSKLSATKKLEYAQQLIELKNEYYQKLVLFVQQSLTTDYMKYEFFRNIKFAIRDFELATKSELIDKTTGQWKSFENLSKKIEITQAMNQCQYIKQRLLSTELTNQQKSLVEELTQLLYKYIE